MIREWIFADFGLRQHKVGTKSGILLFDKSHWQMTYD
jgi:hypothetical protein